LVGAMPKGRDGGGKPGAIRFGDDPAAPGPAVGPVRGAVCPGVAALAGLVVGVRALSLNGGGAEDANRRVAGPCGLAGVVGRALGGTTPGERERTGPFPSPPGGVLREFTDPTPYPRLYRSNVPTETTA